MKRVVWLVCAMLVLPCLLAGQNQNTVRELRELNDAYDQACVRGDFAALERMVASDYSSIGADGKLRSRADVLRRLQSGDVKVESARSDDVAVRVYGNTAVITGRWKGKGQTKGESWTADERYTSMLVKRDGRWQYVADHASEVKQEKQ